MLTAQYNAWGGEILMIPYGFIFRLYDISVVGAKRISLYDRIVDIFIFRGTEFFTEKP